MVNHVHGEAPRPRAANAPESTRSTARALAGRRPLLGGVPRRGEPRRGVPRRGVARRAGQWRRDSDPQRPGPAVRLSRDGRAVVPRAQGASRARPVDRCPARPVRPRDPRARRHDRGLRVGARSGRPRVHRRTREGHPSRREGPHRGVRRPRRNRAHPQGDDQPGPDGERRADAGAPGAGARPRPGGGRPGSPRRAGLAVRRPAADRTQPQRRRTDHDPGQAVRLGRRGADRGVRTCRGPARALPAARDQGAGRHCPGHARPPRRRRPPPRRPRAACRDPSGLHRGPGLGRPDLPAFPGPRRALRTGPGRGWAVEPGDHDPADGRQRAGDRGVQGGPGRILGHAPQDELALL